MAQKSIKIHEAKMSDEMQREALQVALLALNMYDDRTDIASYISNEFIRKHGGTWHCIVGDCGYLVRQTSYIHFSIGRKTITLFKSD